MSAGLKDLKIIGGSSIRKIDIFQKFLFWACLPEDERMRMGMETQEDFAKAHDVSEQTLSQWKQRDDYKLIRGRILADWGKHRTPTVLKSTYKSAIKGNVMAQMLWLQYFEGHSNKSAEKSADKDAVVVQLTENDIRFLINLLPEESRKKYYGDLLHGLLAELQHLRQTGHIQDAVIASDGPASDVSDEAHQPSQGVSDTGTHAVSSGDQDRVCENMERQVSTYHYQSASWRW